MVEPTNVTIFTDWYSVNQIPNSRDKYMHAKVAGLYDSSNPRNLVGYELTVYRDEFPTIGGAGISYRVRIEDTSEGSWSLSNEQAVEFLNTIGFNCRLVSKNTIIPQKVRDMLKAFRTFGFTHICRLFGDSKDTVEIWAAEDQNRSLTRVNEMPNYEYHDWDFLPAGVPRLIEGLLNGSEDPDQSANQSEDEIKENEDSEDPKKEESNE